jgi:hypothetical protein
LFHATVPVTVNFHPFHLSLDVINFALVYLAVTVSIELCPHRFAVLIERPFVHMSIAIAVHRDAEQHTIPVMLPLVGLAILVVGEASHFLRHSSEGVVTNSKHPSMMRIPLSPVQRPDQLDTRHHVIPCVR